MVKLYVLPTKEDQALLLAGERPRNCFVREFDTHQIAQAYLRGLLIGFESNVIRESYQQMTVVFGGSENEEVFSFESVAEKGAFRQGLEDGEGYPAPSIFDEESDAFPALESMYASDMGHVFIHCEEGSLGLLKSFGAKVGAYDLLRHGAMAEVSSHVLEQINQFPADFEVELDLHEAIAEVVDVEPAEAEEEKAIVRSAMLLFLRQERAKVTTVGILNLKTILLTDAHVKTALIGATTEWVRKTEEGRKLWSHSCEDLNIGDLASSGAFNDEVFLAALAQRGVEYVSCVVGGTEDAIAYDQVLVDASALQEKQIEIAFAGAA